MILLKNPRDKSQIISLARQLYPTNMRYLQEVYRDATSRPFGYLLIDMTPDTPEELRCRTLITSGDVPAKYKHISGLCPIIYQEDGHGGQFTKSYSILENAKNQKGGHTSSVGECADDGDTEISELSVRPEHDLRSCLHRLDVVARTKDSRRRKSLLRELSHDDKINHTLRFIARNTINRRIPLEKHHKVKLIKHSGVIQQLAKENISKSKSKQLIEQSGGFLQVLVPIAIELVSDLIEEYI